MLPFKLVYSDGYYLPIGAHVFPAEKYRLIHQRLLKDQIAEPGDFVEPSPASNETILRVTTKEYVKKLKQGPLRLSEKMNLEWRSWPKLVAAFWLAAAASTRAADLHSETVRLSILAEDSIMPSPI